MVPWYWIAISNVLCFILAYAFHGTWKAVVRKIESPLYTHLGDIRTQLNAAINDATTDVNVIKSRLQPIITRIEKVIP